MKFTTRFQGHNVVVSTFDYLNIGDHLTLTLIFTDITNVVQPVSSNYPGQGLLSSSLLVFQTGHLVQSPNGPVCMPTVVPTTHLPGQGPQIPPNTSANASTTFGYTSNHLVYHKTHQMMASNAYTLHGGHIIVVEVRAVYMPVVKTKAQLIGVSF